MSRAKEKSRTMVDSRRDHRHLPCEDATSLPIPRGKQGESRSMRGSGPRPATTRTTYISEEALPSALRDTRSRRPTSSHEQEHTADSRHVSLTGGVAGGGRAARLGIMRVTACGRGHARLGPIRAPWLGVV